MISHPRAWGESQHSKLLLMPSYLLYCVVGSKCAHAPTSTTNVPHKDACFQDGLERCIGHGRQQFPRADHIFNTASVEDDSWHEKLRLVGILGLESDIVVRSRANSCVHAGVSAGSARQIMVARSQPGAKRVVACTRAVMLSVYA